MAFGLSIKYINYNNEECRISTAVLTRVNFVFPMLNNFAFGFL